LPAKCRAAPAPRSAVPYTTPVLALCLVARERSVRSILRAVRDCCCLVRARHVNAFPALKDGDFCNQRATFRPEK